MTSRALDAMQSNWKVGDWCFYAFELGQVQRVFGDGGYEVGNGHAGTSGKLGDRMFPLDYTILQISTSYEWDYRALQWEADSINLNWPDIRRWFESEWADACRNKDDEEYVKTALQRKSKFVRDIRDGIRDLRTREVGGIRAFARR